MLNIVGWMCILIGIVSLFQPEKLRNKMKKQGVKKLRKIFFGIALAFGLFLIKGAWGVPGVLAKILIVLGLIGIAKAFFFLKAKAADAFVAWFLEQPIKYFRFYATAYIVLGALILTVR